MIEKLKRRFGKRRLVLIVALVLVALYVGWRTGGFEVADDRKPCVEGRQEIRDDKGQVVQVIRTSCFKQGE